MNSPTPAERGNFPCLLAGADSTFALRFGSVSKFLRLSGSAVVVVVVVKHSCGALTGEFIV